MQEPHVGPATLPLSTTLLLKAQSLDLVLTLPTCRMTWAD